MLEKLRGALQMKMTASCGTQKFRLKEKIQHLSKYWGVVNTCGVDAYAYISQIVRLFILRQHSNSTQKLHLYECNII